MPKRTERGSLVDVTIYFTRMGVSGRAKCSGWMLALKCGHVTNDMHGIGSAHHCTFLSVCLRSCHCDTPSPGSPAAAHSETVFARSAGLPASPSSRVFRPCWCMAEVANACSFSVRRFRRNLLAVSGEALNGGLSKSSLVACVTQPCEGEWASMRQ